MWIIAFDVHGGNKLRHYRILNCAIPDLGIPELACLNKPVIEVSPDGRHVAFGNCNGELILLDTKTGRESIKVRSYFEVYKRKHHPGYPSVQNIQFDPKNTARVYCVMSDGGTAPHDCRCGP